MFRALLFATAAMLGSVDARAGGAIQMPPHSTLVAQSQVNEIRAFPEVISTSEGRSIAQSERSFAQAVDRLYDVPMSYDESVGFFDDQFKKTKTRVLARTVTTTATAWTLRRPDNTVAHAVVRNTTPTTVEVSEVASLDAPSFSTASQSL